MKLIYNEIKDTRLKHSIPINSKQETLLYEGLQHEDGLISRPYIDIKEIDSITTIQKQFSNTNTFLKTRVSDISLLSNLEYEIIKENMIESGVVEMVFFLNRKLHWLAFRIERSMEYSNSSDRIKNDIDRELIFVVKEYDDISKIPEDTEDGSIIYLKEYSYRTI